MINISKFEQLDDHLNHFVKFVNCLIELKKIFWQPETILS